VRYAFYGAALQGAVERGDRAGVHKRFIEFLKGEGFKVLTEHTVSQDRSEAHRLLDESIGPLPPAGLLRSSYVRNKMIELVESDIDVAVFEVSTPSLGTGIEVAHAYLRPRMGLKKVPVIALYERGYWPNGLTTMIRGITKEGVGHFHLIEYDDVGGAVVALKDMLDELLP
jgi:hypothetical protein